MDPDNKPAGDTSTAPSGGNDPSKQDPPKQDPPAGDPPKDTKAEPPKVPDKYDFTLKSEDGNEVKLDLEAANAFAPVLKKHGISQEAVNELLPLLFGEFDRQDQMISELYTAQRDSWVNAAKSDKEFGGVNYDANVRVAQSAMARFGNPALKELLNQTGLGDHVEVLRFFHKVGQAISEDGHVSGGTKATGDEDSALAKLFDHPTSQHKA